LTAIKGVCAQACYDPAVKSQEEKRLRRAFIAVLVALLVAAGFVAGEQWQTSVRAQGVSVTMECGVSSAARIRTTLYFGLSRPKGSVSELEWQIFLRDEVTRRFPDGLTVWQAEGQWQTPAGSIDREQSKVLLLVHGDTAAERQSVQGVIHAYRKAFDQESVLWESARVCVAG
jgi:hypothetical protein